jgi:tellurite resistance protein
MFELTRSKLEPLRDQLRARGQRMSMVLPVSQGSKELIEAMRVVEEWGAFCEAMYLMMAADRRVLNVEREVLRGALAVLSNDTVRTRHMDAMLDAAARKVGEEGMEKRTQKVIDALKHDRARAEMAVVVAAAVATADNEFVPEEHALLKRLVEGFGIDDVRAAQLLGELEAEIAAVPVRKKS